MQKWTICHAQISLAQERGCTFNTFAAHYLDQESKFPAEPLDPNLLHCNYFSKYVATLASSTIKIQLTGICRRCSCFVWFLKLTCFTLSFALLTLTTFSAWYCTKKRTILFWRTQNNLKNRSYYSKQVTIWHLGAWHPQPFCRNANPKLNSHPGKKICMFQQKHLWTELGKIKNIRKGENMLWWTLSTPPSLNIQPNPWSHKSFHLSPRSEHSPIAGSHWDYWGLLMVSCFHASFSLLRLRMTQSLPCSIASRVGEYMSQPWYLATLSLSSLFALPLCPHPRFQSRYWLPIFCIHRTLICLCA